MKEESLQSTLLPILKEALLALHVLTTKRIDHSSKLLANALVSSVTHVMQAVFAIHTTLATGVISHEFFTHILYNLPLHSDKVLIRESFAALYRVVAAANENCRKLLLGHLSQLLVPHKLPATCSISSVVWLLGELIKTEDDMRVFIEAKGYAYLTMALQQPNSLEPSPDFSRLLMACLAYSTRTDTPPENASAVTQSFNLALKQLTEWLVQAALFSDQNEEAHFTALICFIEVFGESATKLILLYLDAAAEGLVSSYKRDQWGSFIHNNQFRSINEAKVTRCFELFKRLLQGVVGFDPKVIAGLGVNLMLLGAEYSSRFLSVFEDLMHSHDAIKSLIQADQLFPTLLLGLLLQNLNILKKGDRVYEFLLREFPLAHKRMDEHALRNIVKHFYKHIADKSQSNMRALSTMSDFVNESSIEELTSYVLGAKIMFSSEICFTLLFDSSAYEDLNELVAAVSNSTNAKLQALVSAASEWPTDRIEMRLAEVHKIEDEEEVIEMKDMEPEDDHHSSHPQPQQGGTGTGTGTGTGARHPADDVD